MLCHLLLFTQIIIDANSDDMMIVQNKTIKDAIEANADVATIVEGMSVCRRLT